MKRPRPAIRSYSGLLLVGAVIFQVSFLPAQAIPIAVMDFDGFGISQVEAIALSNRLRNELFRLGAFEVVDRGMMENILREQNFQMTGCTSNECLVEVGRLLGAKQMMGGSISKVGNTFSVSARLVDVGTGRLLAVSDYDLKAEIDDMLTTGMRVVALMLSGDEEGANKLSAQLASSKETRDPTVSAPGQPVGMQRQPTTSTSSQPSMIVDPNIIRLLKSRLYDFDYQLVFSDPLKMAVLEAQLKNPYIAAILSLPPPPFNAGLGHAYAGNWLRGIKFIGGAIGGAVALYFTGFLIWETGLYNLGEIVGMIGGPGLYISIWTWQVIDAWKGAKEYNQKLYNQIYLGQD